MNVTGLARREAERLAEHLRKRFAPGSEGGEGIEVVDTGGRLEVRVSNRKASVQEFGDLETVAVPWVYGLVHGSNRGNSQPR